MTPEGIIEVALATHNMDKVGEIRAILEPGGDIRLLSPEELTAWEEVAETGATIEENAQIKALSVAKVLGRLTLADDTALEVEALDEAPGVYSSRYAGPDASYADNCLKLLAEMDGVGEGMRGARFRTAVVAAVPDEVLFTVEGSLEGVIATESRGESGFGYDPIFLLPQTGKTLAEISPQEKNAISHRFKAFSSAAKKLRELAEKGEI